jgi:anti-anti-sigma regulatory factor
VKTHDADGHLFRRATAYPALVEAWLTHRSVRDLRPGDLAWLAFANEEEQGHIIGPFVRGGLDGEDTVIYVTDAASGQLPGLAGTGPAEHVKHGRLRLIPWRKVLHEGHFESARMLATLQAEIACAVGAGARGVRVTADMSWAVRDVGVDRILDCERQFGAAVAASTMITAICQVDRRRLTEAELVALRAAHEVAVRPNPEFEDGVLRITRTFAPPGLQLEGELDGARHAVFAETLSSIARTDRDVHLDVGGLRFMDLGALHLLTTFVSRRRGCGRLLLDNLAPELATVIDTVGWHRLPGLAYGQGAPS